MKVPRRSGAFGPSWAGRSARRLIEPVAALSPVLVYLLQTVSAAGDTSVDGWRRRGPEIRVEARAAIVSPGDAAALIESGMVRVLDVRDPDRRADGRLVEAVGLDVAAWKRWSIDEDVAMLDPLAWRLEAGRIGIDGEGPTLLVDDGTMTGASRAWFILRHAGARDVMVVDGGLAALRNVMPESAFTCDVDGRATTPPSAEVGAFGDAAPPIAWLDRLQTLALLGDGSVQVIDVRSPEEFEGSRGLRNPRSGHLPGAILLPHRELLAEGGGLAGVPQVRACLKARGVDANRPLVVYCQSGARATLAALAIARAGHGPVACYYEGFGAWSRDPVCPVVAPAIEGGVTGRPEAGGEDAAPIR